MDAWTAYWNGRFVPDDQIRISPWDRGFTLGDAAYEVTRTYHHVPFHLDWHFDRLFDSLAALELSLPFDREVLGDLTYTVLGRNRPRLGPRDDVLLTHRITRGPSSPPLGGLPPGPPTVLITCRPVPFASFARLYHEGVEIEIPSVRMPAAGGIDPRIKTQSRLLLALGAVQVAHVGPRVLPLFVDVAGYVTESAAANVFFVKDGRLVTPPDEAVLGGITRRVVLDLASREEIETTVRRVHLRELGEMDEAFLTATSFGLLPIHSLSGRALRPVPGRLTSALTALFIRHVGVDIVAQSLAHVA